MQALGPPPPADSHREQPTATSLANCHSTCAHSALPTQDPNALLNIALHCTALHCSALHCTAQHCIALHYTALRSTARTTHPTTLYRTALLHCCFATTPKKQQPSDHQNTNHNHGHNHNHFAAAKQSTSRLPPPEKTPLKKNASTDTPFCSASLESSSSESPYAFRHTRHKTGNPDAGPKIVPQVHKILLYHLLLVCCGRRGFA